MSKCADCKFAKPIQIPAPLPEPQKVSLLWGLITYTEDEDDYARGFHDYAVSESQHKILCARYPELIKKSKGGFCGEFSAPAAPAQEAK